MKDGIAELDLLIEKHRLEPSVDGDKDTDYKYLYHEALQKRALKKTVSEPSVRRVSRYK
jgi:hypothetical protein